VIRADVLGGYPLFLMGLVQTLAGAGINVVSVRTTPDEEPSWMADVVVIDADVLRSPGDLDPISEAARCAAVLVVTSDAAADAASYLRAGASGVITKRDPGERVVTAVRAVASGAHVGPDIGDSPVAGPSEVSGQHLTEREQQVLRQISHGLTHGQIASRLAISPHTVDTYVKRLRAKLGVRNKAELTRAALLDRRVVQMPWGLDA
jgi:DNA-binding NarL/FixJ family response regulator